MGQTIRSISGRLRALEDSKAFKTLNTQADTFLGGIRTMGIALLGVVGVMGGLARSVIGTGAEFEATLMGAVARFPGEIQRGSAAFEELNDAAERLGATTEFDAQQAAGALQVYAASGFNATLAITSLSGAGNLATISGLTLDNAAKTAADSLGALGLRTENAADQAANLSRLNDVLARTTSLANTSVTEMSEAIATGGSIARSSGQSLETFGAMVASMAGSNIKGAEAGTAIRNTLAALQAPASRAAASLRRMGIDVRDSDGNMRDMIDVVGDFERATSSMGDVARNQAIAQIFGREGMGGFNAMLTTGSEGMRRMRAELDNSGGAAERMAGVMRDTTTNAIDGFTSAIDGVKTAIFGVVSGPFRELLGQLTEWTAANTAVITSGIAEFMAGFASNLETIKARASGLAVLIAGFAALALGIKAVAAATALWNMIAAANPYVLGIMAIIAAVALLVAYWPEISGFFSDLWDKAKDVASSIGEWFAAKWADITSAIGVAVDFIVGLFVGFWTPIIDGFVAFSEFVAGLVVIVAELLRPIWEPALNAMAIAAAWIAAKWEWIKAVAVGVWSAISAKVASVWASIVGGVTRVTTAIASKFTEAWNGIASAAASVYARITNAFTPIVTFFSGLWTGIVNSFNEIMGPILNTAGSIIDAIRNIGARTMGTDGPEDGPRPQVVPPRSAPANGGTNSTSTNNATATVTVRAAPGTSANVSRQPRGGTPIRVARSGA